MLAKKNNSGEPGGAPAPNADLPSDETLMTTVEVMRFLNLSRTKVWMMIQNEGLPAFKFGGDYRFRKSELVAWMERYRFEKKG